MSHRIAYTWGYTPDAMSYTGITPQFPWGCHYNPYSGDEIGNYDRCQTIDLPDFEGTPPARYTFAVLHNPDTGNMLEFGRKITHSFLDNYGHEVVIDFIRACHVAPETHNGGSQDLAYPTAWDNAASVWYTGIGTRHPNVHAVGGSYDPPIPVFGMGMVPPTHVGRGNGAEFEVDGRYGLWTIAADDIAGDPRVAIIPAVLHPVEGTFLYSAFIAVPLPSQIGHPGKNLIIAAKYNILADLGVYFDDVQGVVTATNGPLPDPIATQIVSGVPSDRPVGFDWGSLGDGHTYQIAADQAGTIINAIGYGPQTAPATFYPPAGFPGSVEPALFPGQMTAPDGTVIYAPGRPMVTYDPATGNYTVTIPSPESTNVVFAPPPQNLPELDLVEMTSNQDKLILDISFDPMDYISNDIMPTGPEYTGPNFDGLGDGSGTGSGGGDLGMWGDWDFSDYWDGSWDVGNEDPGGDPGPDEGSGWDDDETGWE